MLGLSKIKVTFTTMSSKIISSSARHRACSFNLVFSKTRSSFILTFTTIFAYSSLLSTSSSSNFRQIGCPSLFFHCSWAGFGWWEEFEDGNSCFCLLYLYSLSLLRLLPHMLFFSGWQLLRFIIVFLKLFHFKQWPTWRYDSMCNDISKQSCS